ncbi:phenylacetate--CoA ligase family protein [Alistipes timonensis]
MFYKLIYLAGIKRRNPSLLPYFEFLKETDRWSIDKLRVYQFEKCREFLIFARNNSPFYQEHFAKAGFVPERMQSVDDLKQIPPIDKIILLEYGDRIRTNYSFRRLLFSETSGTSGQVLRFYRNEEWDSHNRAAMFRGYGWYGVNPWLKNGYFWGYDTAKRQYWKTAFLDALQNRFRLFSYDAAHIRQFVEKLKGAEFLTGYSSMIYEVAKIINRLNIGAEFNLKMIKGTSEKICESYQTEVQKAFGRKIISEYGSAESGLIAFECPEGGHMHINMENVVVEEENGEIIVTNLLSRSFPIIRYRLGDFVKLASSDFKCSCGRAHPVVLDVLGRVGKNVIGKKSIYPSLTFYYVFKNLVKNGGISLNYQAEQHEKVKVLLRIEQDEAGRLPALEMELAKYFRHDIEFEIRWGEVLHSMDGKLKDFVTTLN